MTGIIDKKLKEIGVSLPIPARAVANYVPYVIDGHNLYISGQLPMGTEGLAYTGKVGMAISVENGAKAAETCAINLLAQAKAALSDLDRIDRVLKLVGFVNCPDQFEQHPVVINGASDLMVKVFDDAGRHARSAVGVSSLPFNASVEVEAIFRIK